MYELQPLRTQAEVARILTERGEPITRGGVHMAEKTAIAKLKEALIDEAIDRGWFRGDNNLQESRKK